MLNVDVKKRQKAAKVTQSVCLKQKRQVCQRHKRKVRLLENVLNHKVLEENQLEWQRLQKEKAKQGGRNVRISWANSQSS